MKTKLKKIWKKDWNKIEKRSIESIDSIDSIDIDNFFVRSKIFEKIDCVETIDSVQKSSKSEPSLRFFGRLKILRISIRSIRYSVRFDRYCVRAPLWTALTRFHDRTLGHSHRQSDLRLQPWVAAVRSCSCSYGVGCQNYLCSIRFDFGVNVEIESIIDFDSTTCFDFIIQGEGYDQELIWALLDADL